MTRETCGRCLTRRCCEFSLFFLVCVGRRLQSSSTLNRTGSIATFFGHVPWLGVYVGKIPAATGNLMVLLNNCADRVKARLKRGSEKKDLFHYLVRPRGCSVQPSPRLKHSPHTLSNRTTRTCQTRPRPRCSSSLTMACLRSSRERTRPRARSRASRTVS